MIIENNPKVILTAQEQSDLESVKVMLDKVCNSFSCNCCPLNSSVNTHCVKELLDSCTMDWIAP